MTDESQIEPDRISGAPHPRDTVQLFGQKVAESAFLEAYNKKRLHSGWLVTGPQGIGKATLAYRIATFLLSEQPEDGGLFGAPPPPDTLAVLPDQVDARLVRAGSHPRLCILRRATDEKTGKLRSQITVDEVRRLKSFFNLSAVDGGRRVVIVDAADEMNPSAANAILKVLEEPPARTTLLLVSHQPTSLLPTIRSRCRSLRLGRLGPDDLGAALAQADLPMDRVEALSVLADGSVGQAIRLAHLGGLDTYRDLVSLLGGLPQFDRTGAIRLAESCTGKGAGPHFAHLLDLIDLFLSRTARAGLMGEPDVQGAPGEARLLARLAPHDAAARRWAQLQQDLSARIRHGKAVNLDPASLILDTLFRIEETARLTAAA
jgi:DNA polymerase III subunit delta'